jgi:hypothetical protein
MPSLTNLLHRRRHGDRHGPRLIDAAASTAPIGAGLLSVLPFPLTGLILLTRNAPPEHAAPPADVQPEAAAPLMAM